MKAANIQSGGRRGAVWQMGRMNRYILYQETAYIPEHGQASAQFVRAPQYKLEQIVFQIAHWYQSDIVPAEKTSAATFRRQRLIVPGTDLDRRRIHIVIQKKTDPDGSLAP